MAEDQKSERWEKISSALSDFEASQKPEKIDVKERLINFPETAKKLAGEELNKLGETAIKVLERGALPEAGAAAGLGAATAFLWVETGKAISMAGGIAQYLSKDYGIPTINLILPMMAALGTTGTIMYAGIATEKMRTTK